MGLVLPIFLRALSHQDFLLNKKLNQKDSSRNFLHHGLTGFFKSFKLYENFQTYIFPLFRDWEQKRKCQVSFISTLPCILQQSLYQFLQKTGKHSNKGVHWYEKCYFKLFKLETFQEMRQQCTLFSRSFQFHKNLRNIYDFLNFFHEQLSLTPLVENSLFFKLNLQYRFTQQI